MTEPNRRKFLAVTGAGAAGAAVVGVTGIAGSASATTRNGKHAKEAVVAYVADHRSDEVVLHVGEREVRVNDPELAARILNAAGGN